MAVTDTSRYHLHQRLEAVLGKEDASVLMEHLPPVGWADVATRRDLDHLEAIMDHRFAAIDSRFDGMEHRFAALESRLDGIDGRIDGLDATMDQRFQAIEGRLEAMLANGLRAQEIRFDAFNRQLLLMFVGLAATILVSVGAAVLAVAVA